jgi:4-amino-4-deoxy-L-arabinose transferase-like glycosyltransferase
VLILVVRRQAPRTDVVRAAAILFGGWLIVDGLVLSFMHGMVHPYYSLSIAPPIAAMSAIGAHEIWCHRRILGVMVLGTGLWAWWILSRNSTWLPGLRWAILALTAFAAVVLVGPWSARRGFAMASVSAGVVSALAGPAAYAIATIGLPHNGGGPTVGTATAAQGARRMVEVGGDNPDLDAILKGTDTAWSAAVNRSSSAAGLELASGTAVMAIGGFTGSDPTPTLAQFQDDVARHKVAYYIVANNHNRWPGRSNRDHADIAKWVAASFPATTVGDATVYDLSAPK